MDLIFTGPYGAIGGGYLKDLKTIYVQQRLSSKDWNDGMSTLSPPKLTFRQPGLPERNVGRCLECFRAKKKATGPFVPKRLNSL